MGVLDMKKRYKKYIGKRLDWDTIQELFPYRWILCTECTFDGADFDTGIIMAVCTDDELQTVIENFIKSGVNVFWKWVDCKGGPGVIW
jgi:hypothetical protein